MWYVYKYIIIKYVHLHYNFAEYELTPVQTTKKRTLADVYDEVVSVTSAKKTKLKSKEAYSSVNNRHKEEIYEMEKRLKSQEFEHNAVKMKILNFEEKKAEVELKKAEVELKKAEVELKKAEMELKKAEMELKQKEIEFNKYG